MMIYDRDIWKVGIKDGKVYLEFFCPTEEAIFTREDLVFLLKQIEQEGGKCQHKDMMRATAKDMTNQYICCYEICPDCGHNNETKSRMR